MDATLAEGLELADLALEAVELSLTEAEAKSGLRHPNHARRLKPLYRKVRKLLAGYFDSQGEAIEAAVKPWIELHLQQARMKESEAVDLEEGWVTMDGAHVFIGEDGVITKGPAGLVGQAHHGPVVAMSKSEIAKATYSGGLKVHQDLGDKTAREVSKALGIPETSDNKAFDVENKKYGIEVKTLVTQKNEKITMNKYAQSLKAARQKEAKLKAFTVVIDKRPKGLGSSTGETRIFVKQGFGSFRVGSMTEVKSMGAIKGFMRKTQ